MKHQIRTYSCRPLCTSSSFSLSWIFSSSWGTASECCPSAYLSVGIRTRALSLWHFAVPQTHCKCMKQNKSLPDGHVHRVLWSAWPDIWYLMEYTAWGLVESQLYMMHILKWFFLLSKTCLTFLSKYSYGFVSILFFLEGGTQNVFQYDFLEWEERVSN